MTLAVLRQPQDDKVCRQTLSRGGAVAARVAHNHEVRGSSPLPATMQELQIEIGSKTSLFLIYYCAYLC